MTKVQKPKNDETHNTIEIFRSAQYDNIKTLMQQNHTIPHSTTLDNALKTRYNLRVFTAVLYRHPQILIKKSH